MPQRKAPAAALVLAALLYAQSEYEAAEQNVRGGRSAEAVPVLQRRLAQSPSDLKARNLLGIALMNLGRNTEARAQFEKALAIDPAFHAALKNLAVDEMALSRKAEAKHHFEQLLKVTPDDPVAHFYLGEMAFANGAYPEALAHYEPLARRGYPDAYRAGFNLTLVYVNAGNYAGAIRAGEALAREHATAELHNLLARAYEGAGRTQQAYDSLRTATQLDPQDERNYVDLMSLCLGHENWELSLEISEVALHHMPGAFRIRLLRGAVFAMKGQLPEAESEFQESARLAPDSGLPVAALGLAEMDGKRPGKAVELLRARRARRPREFLTDWMLAEALAQAGEEGEEAIGALEEAVKLNPSMPAAHTLLGKLLVKRGEPNRAAGEFEKALKLKPDDHMAAYQLAMIYRKAGNLARAEALMAIAQKAASVPEDAQARRQDLVKIILESSK